MSDVKPNKTDSQRELTPEEQEIDRRLEAKVGLGLVVLLAGAFGFMVWQKWTHRHQETYAQNETESTVQQSVPGDPKKNQPPLVLDQPEPKPKTQLDPFAEKQPIVQVSDKTEIHPLLKTGPSQEQFSDKKPEPGNLEKPEQSDPFGDVSTSKAVVEKPQPSEAGDPFGDEWASSPKPAEKPKGSPVVESKPEETPVLDLNELVTDAENPSTTPQEDPFGETSGPTPELTTKTSDGDPFTSPEPQTSPKTESEPEFTSKPLEYPDGPTLTPQPKQSVASSKEEFTEPMPVLERVPERSETASKSPFGDFEPVPVRSSQASSTTNVSAGDFPAEKDPFATPIREEPKELDFRQTPLRNDILRTYRIEQNDTYWKISQKAYRTSRYYQALARYNQNRISDPTKMPLGQEILLPPERELEIKYPDLFPSQQAAARTIVQTGGDNSGFLTDKLGTPQYRVGENDTLSAIAQRHLGRASRWIQIYELNRKEIPDPNKLKIGTILTLPADASNVRVIGERADSTLR